MELIEITDKGQLTLPKEVCQRLGIHQGSQIELTLVKEHLELRVKHPSKEPPPSGFGMLKSQRATVPADFDVVSLFNQ